jgi:aspartyl-tRNA(Asn)/glutamyl-tRNA(Gln) amidotransferase subunit A
MFGSLMLSSLCYDTYYRKALQARFLIRDTYKKLFERFDIIMSPISTNINDPVKTFMKNIFTAPVNLAGLPALVLPCGFDKQAGFQLIGDTFSEPKLINAARAYQWSKS